ncbi:Hypothetical predicted protein [Pelobates cultripes]|uniref:Uncharacterized protein n=1 Tax=Pelobates cultripes TaxID=61616 RepID=A0AAD1WNH0_PELCU|nr:Hypothetical predicted protein [Pelobates cultripes]
MAAATTRAFHEARIEQAFERFWSQFWATVAQRAESATTASSTLTNPRSVLNPQPALHGRDKAPKAKRRRKKKRRAPQSQKLSTAGSLFLPKPQPKQGRPRSQGSTPRPVQALSKARGRTGTIPTRGIAAGCLSFLCCKTALQSIQYEPVNGTIILYDLPVYTVSLPISGVG